MMQTDVNAKYMAATGAVTSDRSRLKGLVFTPAATNTPNTAFVDPSVTYAGTYSQSTTTITVTYTNHGFVVGQRVALSFTSGAATSGSFAVATVVDANTFTVTTTVSATVSTSNVTIYPLIELEIGVVTTGPYSVTIPGEGVLFSNGIYNVGSNEVTVFYG